MSVYSLQTFPSFSKVYNGTAIWAELYSVPHHTSPNWGLAESVWFWQHPLHVRCSKCDLCGLLSTWALSGSSLHRLLPPHLPHVYGGKWNGVLHHPAEQKHAHCNQPLHSQPGHQWPAGRHLLHANHSCWQHHHRSVVYIWLQKHQSLM